MHGTLYHTWHAYKDCFEPPRISTEPFLLACIGMARAHWSLQDYGHCLKVHNGYASSVYQAVCRHSGRRVALKVYEADKLHVISQHQLMREARMHPMLAHPNIVKMYASFRQVSFCSGPESSVTATYCLHDSFYLLASLVTNIYTLHSSHYH